MSLIDIASLLSPISADAPGGEDLEYDPQFIEMEKLAQGTPERQYGNTIIPSEPPDWRGVGAAALSILERSRDLRAAMHLTRSLLNTDGLIGFSEGLALLEGLIEQHWEHLFPLLDPEDDYDPTLRINTLLTLCDVETTLHDLRTVPLVVSRAFGRVSLRDVQIATGLLAPVTVEGEEAATLTLGVIDGAFQDAPLEDVHAVAEAVTTALARVKQIETLLTDRVGVSQAADFSSLSKVLREIDQVFKEQLRRREGTTSIPAEEGELAQPEEDPGEDEAEEGTTAPLPRTRRGIGEISDRDEVIRALDKICAYYERYEPSSPVPFLLKRARRLVPMNFMEILHDLAPGGTEQADLIFGTPTEEEAE